jgi:sporulation protein YlmC with PRC-barrel domain
MKSLLLGGVTALALTFAVSAQAADTNGANNATTNNAPAATANASGNNGQFITTQQAGELRAPKLVGVAVYDKQNKSIGKISDLLMDKDGKIQAVVIGIGGFLGIGTKDVALPYDQIHWQTEQRTVATNGTAPGATGNAMNNTAVTGNAATPGGVTGTTTANNANTTQPAGGQTANNGQMAQKTATPAQQEAYNGYPDRAVVDMSQQQLKDAPEFKYASQTANSAAEVKKQ